MPGWDRQVDLTNNVLDGLLSVTTRHDGFDAVVRLAAIPVDGLVPDAATFHDDVTITFDIHAALDQIAPSSWRRASRRSDPVRQPRLPPSTRTCSANNTYGLGKVVEAMAAPLVHWCPGCGSRRCGSPS